MKTLLYENKKNIIFKGKEVQEMIKSKRLEINKVKIEKPKTLDQASKSDNRVRKWLCKGKDAQCRSC